MRTGRPGPTPRNHRRAPGRRASRRHRGHHADGDASRAPRERGGSEGARPPPPIRMKRYVSRSSSSSPSSSWASPSCPSPSSTSSVIPCCSCFPKTPARTNSSGTGGSGTGSAAVDPVLEVRQPGDPGGLRQILVCRHPRLHARARADAPDHLPDLRGTRRWRFFIAFPSGSPPPSSDTRSSTTSAR